MAIIVYLTIYTGALVRHTKSSLAYGAWPIPFDDIVPHNAHDWVQFSHRGMAFITFIWIMITFIHAIKIIQIIELYVMVILHHLYLLSFKLLQVLYQS